MSLNYISSEGSEIETLFVERAVQLLKSGGLAAIILPSPILSKGIGSYVAARSLLIKNFFIRSIVSLESKTFGATNTSTVVLFLQRYDEPPKLDALANDVADAILSGKDLTNWEDEPILVEYLKRIGVSRKEYDLFRTHSLNKEGLKTIEYFNQYVEAFSQTTQSYPKRVSEEERAAIENQRLNDYIFSIEKEKIVIFTLVRSQITTIVSAPADNQKQKEFLGYDWSNRKGAEGIVIKTPGGKLYHPNDRFARGTLACQIRNSFSGATIELSEELKSYSTAYMLKDLIDFSLPNFDVSIHTSAPKTIELASSFPIFKIRELVVINEYDYNPTQNPEKDFIYVDISSVENETGIISYKTVLKGKDAPSRARRLAKSGSVLISTVRPNLKAFAFVEQENPLAVYSTGFAVIQSKDETKLLNKFIYILFMNLDGLMDQIILMMPKGQYPSINKTDIENLKIPVPPIKIQEAIIKECEEIDKQFNSSRMTISTYRKKIQHIFDELEIVKSSKMGG